MAGELQCRASDGALLCHSDGTLMAECCCGCAACAADQCGQDQPGASCSIAGASCSDSCKDGTGTYEFTSFVDHEDGTCVWEWRYDGFVYDWKLTVECAGDDWLVRIWDWIAPGQWWVELEGTPASITCNPATHHLEGTIDLAPLVGSYCPNCTGQVVLG